MKVYFIRHFATRGNLEGRYVGRTDEGIQPVCKQDLSRIADWTNHTKRPDIIYSSPMKRCQETCELFFPKQSYVTIPDLREIDFGEFEYKSYEELNGNTEYQHFIDSNGRIPFPKAENTLEFRKRCVNAFRGIIKEARKKDYKKIALVVHGGTIMAILEAFSNPHQDYFSWQVQNGSGYIGRIEEEHEGMDISSLHRIWD